jgi:hypothetical protein
MKRNAKLLLLLAGISISYLSCTKNSAPKPTTSSDTQTTDETVARAIALSLSQGLSGSLGGANINDGLKPNTSAVAAKTLASTSPYVCGFVSNPNINYGTNIGDTIKSTTTGSNEFYFNCTNGLPTGYTITDQLYTVGTAPGYSFTYNVGQNYAVTSINQYQTQLSVDGSLKAVKDLTYTNKAYKPSTETDSFQLTNLLLTISATGTTDIYGGTATFTTTGTNASGSWSYVGTLQFLGNNQGKITFYGRIYYINLLTGVVTS